MSSAIPPALLNPNISLAPTGISPSGQITSAGTVNAPAPADNATQAAKPASGGGGVLGIGTSSQLKAITGGLLIGAGGFILVVGVALVATHALGQTSTGSAAIQGISMLPGVGGVVGKVASVVA